MNDVVSQPEHIESPELSVDAESVFRAATFTEDRHTLRLTLVCFFALNAFLLLTELLIVINEPYFRAVLLTRIAVAALIVGLWIWLLRLKSVSSLQALKFSCVASTCGATAIINWLYGTPAILDMVLILVIYTIFPVSLRIAAVGTAILTILTVYLLVPLTDNPYNVDLLAGNFLAHVLGLVVGASQRKRRRELFWSATRDRQLRLSLEAALSEVKRLSGLLRICCVCKKIRDKKGAWIQLEAYLQENSDADFSHGYCPCCYKVAIEEINEYGQNIAKE